MAISKPPINAPVNMTFRIYTSTPDVAIWISALRSVTPTSGLFTVYLGDFPDSRVHAQLATWAVCQSRVCALTNPQIVCMTEV